MATDDVSGSESLRSMPHAQQLQPTSADWADDSSEQPQFFIDKDQLAQALGWFSVGVGLLELLAPRAVGRAIGVGDHPLLMRMCGLREITSGLGLLSKRAPGPWAWSRVAGDAIDMALLKAAAQSPVADHRRIALAATAIAGVTTLDVYAGQQLHDAPGIEPPEVDVYESVTINSTPEALYSFWRDVSNLPRFMRHLESVTPIGERTSHWIATAPAGRTVEWDSEVTDDQPNSRISWRTLPDSQVTHSGSVSFEPTANGRGAIVRVAMSYRPPAGKLGMRIAKLFGEEPKQQIHDDLRRLKQLMEAGEIATTEGQSCGARSIIGRATLKRRLQ